MTSLQERLFAMQDKQYAAFQAKLTPGVPVEVSVSAMLVDTRQKNIAQAFILERYFFVSICPAAIPGTCLAVFLAAVLLLC